LKYPNSDLLRLLHDISLGIAYLHSREVVHGDMKAVNVLIDDNEKAVLCDFGLSRVKDDITSHTVRHTTKLGTATVTRSSNWMAPERLSGGLLKKPSDIYAFGMVVYEIYTNKDPFHYITTHSDFLRRVLDANEKPKKPGEDEAPKMEDDIWELAQGCWVKEPRLRPTAPCLCENISQIVGSRQSKCY